MNRALFWKEMREQGPLILAAWGIAGVLPLFLVVGMRVTTPDYEFAALGEMLPTVLVLILWPVFAAATGASTLASEMADGSLRFLLSRPVSRRRVWAAKVGTATVALLLIVIGSSAISLLFTYVVSGGFHLTATGRVQRGFSVALEPAAAVTVLLAALFVTSLYCSMFFRRPLAAVLAGLVVAGSMAACVLLAWMALVPRGSSASEAFVSAGAAAGVPLGAIGVLIAGYRVFCHGDIRGGNTARRMASPLVVVTLMVMLVGAIPAAYSCARFMAFSAARLPGDYRIIDGVTVLAELTPSELSTQLTLIDARSGETTVLVARHAAAPVISEDGSLVAYIGFRGLRGFASNEVEIRVVRSDGSGDRVVGDGVPWVWGYRNATLWISPDNDYVALYDPFLSVVYVEPLAGGTRRVLPIERFASRGGLIGWTRSAPAELLYNRASRRGRTDVFTEMIAFDPVTGDERVVVGFAGDHDIGLREAVGASSGGRSWAWYPLWTYEYDGSMTRLSLVNTATGQRIALSDTPCYLWGFSGDGGRFYYGDCSREGENELQVQLRVRDLLTGADEPFASLGRIGWPGSELRISPDGDRILLYLRGAGVRGISGTYVVHRDGGASQPPAQRDVELVAVNQIPIGWIDERRVVVARDDHRPDRIEIQVVNLETHAVRKVYPR